MSLFLLVTCEKMASAIWAALAIELTDSVLIGIIFILGAIQADDDQGKNGQKRIL